VNEMQSASQYSALQDQLSARKAELVARLERIKLNVRRGVDADSEERAKQLEDQEVVDALGNEAREELTRVSQALDRLTTGTFGACLKCGADIGAKRLAAYPHAEDCISCASETSEFPKGE
jgi:DnaK suppressor protein